MLQTILCYTILLSSLSLHTSCEKEAVAEKEPYVSSELLTSVPQHLLQTPIPWIQSFEQEKR